MYPATWALVNSRCAQVDNQEWPSEDEFLDRLCSAALVLFCVFLCGLNYQLQSYRVVEGKESPKFVSLFESLFHLVWCFLHECQVIDKTI